MVNQCREAVGADDAERLESLLGTMEGKSMPGWVKPLIPRFRLMLRSMKLKSSGKLAVSFVLPRMDYQVGDIIYIGVRVENRLEVGVQIPESGSAAVVRAVLHFTDMGIKGEVWETKEFVNLPMKKALRLDAGEKRFLGFSPLTASLPAKVVVRTVKFRGDLYAGNVLVDRELLPLKKLPVGATMLRIFPKGYEPIKRKPLLTLEKALELGAGRHLRHIFLAGYFMPGNKEKKARDILEAMVAEEKDKDAREVARAALRILGKGVGVSP